MLDNVLYLHLHRYLDRTHNFKKNISQRSMDLINDLFSEMDGNILADEAYYTLALYRSMSLIDNCILNSYTFSCADIEIIDKYRSLFVDSYVFSMLQIVIFLHLGKKLNSCIYHLIS